ncbi:hypothetical protein COM21_28930 [Bacillus toyonensis]|nr:hypothetical protein COM21_28930 [Bacillus toyonensis]
MDQSGIKNKAQIKTRMKWHRKGETYRFSRPVGKQSTLGVAPTFRGFRTFRVSCPYLTNV